MRPLLGLSSGVVLLAGLVLALSGLAEASVMRALDLEALTDRADDVVVARCVASEARYDERGRIVTDLSLEVADGLKGRHRRGGTLTLTVLGGEIGELGMRVAGAPSITLDEEAVVFAEERPDGHRRPVGLSQGVLPIRREGGRAMVHPGAQGLVLVRGDQGPDRAARAAGALTEPTPLEEVVARVRARVEQGAGR